MDISVVVPVFNSENTIAELCAQTITFWRSKKMVFEIILVDDGSMDGSWQQINTVKTDHPLIIRGIRLNRNYGQQAATFCGLQHALGKQIFTIDDDLQILPEEMEKLLVVSAQENAELVYGRLTGRKQAFFHKTGALFFRYLIRKAVPNFPDGSSFRLIHADIISRIPKDLKQWSYVDPVLCRICHHVATADVRHRKREWGNSGYSIIKLTGIALNILIIYSTFPLRWMIGMGFSAALLSFGMGLFYLIQKITIGAQVGFSALIVTITFFSGIILMSLGILGVYIAKMYEWGSGQPAFNIKETI